MSLPTAATTSTASRLTRRRFPSQGPAQPAPPGSSCRRCRPASPSPPQAPATGDVLVAIFLRSGADGLDRPPFSDTAGYQALRGAGTSNDVAVPPPDPATQRTPPSTWASPSPGHHFGLHPARPGQALSGTPATSPSSTPRACHHRERHPQPLRRRDLLGAGQRRRGRRHRLDRPPPRRLRPVGRHPGVGYDTGGVPMSLRAAPPWACHHRGLPVEGFQRLGRSARSPSGPVPGRHGQPPDPAGPRTRLAAVNDVVAADPAQYDDHAGLCPHHPPRLRAGAGARGRPAHPGRHRPAGCRARPRGLGPARRHGPREQRPRGPSASSSPPCPRHCGRSTGPRPAHGRGHRRDH